MCVTNYCRLLASQFSRAIIKDSEYYSLAYGRLTKRNSYTVCYRETETMQYGFVQCFLSLPNHCVAVIKPFSTTSSFCYSGTLEILRSRIIPVKQESAFDVISVTSFVNKCVCIHFCVEEMYVAVMPNVISDD